MTRTDIINNLISFFGYKSYLEIGLDNPDNNYTRIVCKNKESVDPFFEDDHKNGFDVPLDATTREKIKQHLTYKMTSDEFFETVNRKYDIIFIDGLHTREQVRKDIINSLKHLNKGGKIVVHDALPPNEGAQIVPRQQVLWNGDVWKGIVDLKKLRISFHTVDTDFGCCVIDYFENPETLTVPKKNREYGWSDFVKYRNLLLNVIPQEDFKKTILIKKTPYVWGSKNFMLGDYVYLHNRDNYEEREIIKISSLSNKKIGFVKYQPHLSYVRNCEKRISPIPLSEHRELLPISTPVDISPCKYVHEAQHFLKNAETEDYGS